MSETIPVTGKTKNQNKLVDQVNSATGGEYHIVNGYLEAIDGNYGKGILADLFNEAIRADHEIPIKAFANSDMVYFDNFVNMAIDVEDMAKAPLELRTAIYAHILSERIAAGKNYSNKQFRIDAVGKNKKTHFKSFI